MAFFVFRYTLTWSAAYSILERTPIVRSIVYFDNFNKKDAKINEFVKKKHLFVDKLNCNYLSLGVSF